MRGKATGGDHMHGLEGLDALLGVEAHRIDHGEGVAYGRGKRAVLVDVRPDRLQPGIFACDHAPASFRMACCDANGKTMIEQMANDPPAEKSRAAENDHPARRSHGARPSTQLKSRTRIGTLRRANTGGTFLV